MSKPAPRTGRLPSRTLLAAAALLACGSSQAMEFDTGNPDLKIRWDNTVKYSAAARVEDRLPELSRTTLGPFGPVGPNNINQDDGDNNFNKGLVSNRLDVFSEVDLSYGRFGARLSGAAWYDSVYNGSTDNPGGGPITGIFPNHTPASEFPSETRRLMGRKAELLDAFVYGSFDIGERPATVRFGRHTLLWGESLFFGANGIAGGQAPVDLIKLLSVPNSQFKETARPTGKLSGQVQVSDAVSVGAYVNYEWEPTRLMPVGAYLSASDTLGPGAERLSAGAVTLLDLPDQEPKDSGQGGLQVRWRADALDTDFGFYAIRFHALGPSNIYQRFAPPAPSYNWTYHEGIRAYGASFARAFGEWSVGGEVSVRHNTPLTSLGAPEPFRGFYNNNSNPGYAVGKTAHAQVSWLASLGPSFISREASFLGEVAWNTRTSIDKGANFINPLTDKSATSMRLVYSPSYRQVVSGVDLNPTVGMSYTNGLSSALGPGFGVHKGGDMSIGLNATYLNTWFASVSYVHFYGPTGGSLNNANQTQFKQALKDRDFVTLSLRTTF